MPSLNSKLGIDFSNYIADRTTNFTGREWVFEAIQNWLADPNGERFFLLTGEPGSGKTAIAARLAQFAQGAATYPGLEAGFLQAVHFCSARDSGWTDPKEFARSLALQLAASIPEFGLALKDVGVNTTNINVDLTVGTAQNSDITGVFIQNLTLSDLLTGQEAFTQVVVNPLRQIQQEGFSQPVTILVDSLDEALTHDGKSTIVSLVSNLSANVKLRLILTSRNEGRVKEELEEYKELFLSAPENLYKNQQDVRAYINAKFRQEKPLQNSLQAEALDQEVLTTNLIEKSEGNFLYVRFLLEAVALGQQSFANLNGLPQGLDELYYSSLGRVVKLGKKDWSEVYAPVMGVLLAAQESLTESQIRAFTKLKESVVWDCLTDLQQFLDEIESEDEATLYKLYHQSVTDFLGKKELRVRKEKAKKPEKVKNRYYLPAQEQHQRLLEYYRPEGKLWAEVQLEKIDAYGRRYLAQHLVKAERVEELHTLLSLEKDGKNAWFRVKDEVGDTAGFLADVTLAWELAEQNWTEATLPQVIEKQCLYALILSSLNSLADIPTELLEGLVKVGLPYGWSPEKGLAYARRIPDPANRAKNLEVLIKYLPEEQQAKIWREALSATQAIQDEVDRAVALIALGAHFPEAYKEALSAAQAIQSEPSRAKALNALAAHFPEAYKEALSAVQAIQDEYSRAKPLRVLAAHLPQELYKEVLSAAQDIHHESSRADAPLALGAHLPKELYKEALSAAQDIQDAYSRADALIALGAHLPKELCKEALSAAQDIHHESSRADALIALGAHLPKELYKEALSAAQDIQDESSCAKALRALAAHLPKELYKEALSAAQALQDAYSRASALIALAAHFPEAYKEASSAAQVIQSEFSRTHALIALAAHFPEAYKEALSAAQVIEDSSSRAEALIALAAHFLQKLYKEALSAAQDIQYDYHRASALIALAAHFPEAYKEALSAAQAIQDEYNRTKVLIALAAHLPKELYKEALSAAQAIQDAYSRASALIALAAHFPEAYKEALSAAQDIQHESDCAKALIALAAHLPKELYKEALSAAQDIQHESFRANALIGLAAYFPEAYKEALSATQDIQYESSRADALIALAAHFPELYKEALSAAQDTQDDYSRALALIALAAHFPELYKEALSAAQAIQDESYRATALIALAARLPKELYKEALSAAQAIQSEYSRAEALIALAAHFPELYKEALSAAQAIQDESDRASALIALGAHLPKELYKEALSAAQAIQNESAHTNFLNNLIPQSATFPTSQQFTIWQETLSQGSQRNRAVLLSNLAALVPLIDNLGGKAAGIGIAKSIQKVSEWWR